MSKALSVAARIREIFASTVVEEALDLERLDAARVTSTSGLFLRFRARLADESAADPEPTARFASDWNCWLIRDLRRARLGAEIAEARMLTTNLGDPTPIASQGLAPFLDWVGRQTQRRKARP